MRADLTKVKPSARMRLAARFYATGAAPTKRSAALSAGLHPAYFTRMSVINPEVRSLIGDIDTQINDQSIALSKIIATIARKAASKMNNLIDSPNEHVALKASSDMLDRNPESSKTIKASITNFSLDGQDAKEIALAMVEAARVKERFRELAAGDFVKITEEESSNGAQKETREQVHEGDHVSREAQVRVDAGDGSVEARKEEGP